MPNKKPKIDTKIQGKTLSTEEFNELSEDTRAQLRKKQYQKMGVHSRLREIRESTRQTQSEMAAFFETSQSYYSTYEDGERMLTAPMLMALTEQGFSADYILTGKGNTKLSKTLLNSVDFEVVKKENEHLKSENEFLKKQVSDLMEVLKGKSKS